MAPSQPMIEKRHLTAKFILPFAAAF